MKKIAPILTSLVGVFLFSIATSKAITTSFEEYEGYVTGQSINGVQNWQATQNPIINNLYSHTGDNSLEFYQSNAVSHQTAQKHFATSTAYQQCFAIYFEDDMNYLESGYITFKNTSNSYNCGAIRYNATYIAVWNGTTYNDLYTIIPNTWTNVCMNYNGATDQFSVLIDNNILVATTTKTFGISSCDYLNIQSARQNINYEGYVYIDSFDTTQIDPEEYNELIPETILTNEQGEEFGINGNWKTCIWGQCKLNYWFNETAKGSQAHIILQQYQTENNLDINDAFQSKTLNKNLFGNNGYFDITETVHTEENVNVSEFYCVVFDSQYGEDYDMYFCDIRIDFQLNEPLIDSQISTSTFCQCVSTGDFLDWQTWSCNVKDIVCYLFVPDNYDKLSDAYNEMTGGFPFSIGRQIKDTLDLAVQTYGETEQEVVIAPLMWAGHTTGANLLTNKTLENGMGSVLYEKYYTWFKYILYLFAVLYFARRILRLSDSFDSRFFHRNLEDEKFKKDRRADYYKNQQRRDFEWSLKRQNYVKRFSR